MCALYITNDVAPMPGALSVSLSVLVALTFASVIDIKTHSVSNKFVLALSVVAITASLAFGGLTGLMTSLGSLCLLLVIVLPMFYFGGMAGGDVKLLAAISLLLSPANTVVLILSMFIFGGLLVLFYQCRPGFFATFRLANEGPCRTVEQLSTLPRRKRRSSSRRAVPFVPAITMAVALIILVDTFGATLC